MILFLSILSYRSGILSLHKVCVYWKERALTSYIFSVDNFLYGYIFLSFLCLRVEDLIFFTNHVVKLPTPLHPPPPAQAWHWPVHKSVHKSLIFFIQFITSKISIYTVSHGGTGCCKVTWSNWWKRSWASTHCGQLNELFFIRHSYLQPIYWTPYQAKYLFIFRAHASLFYFISFIFINWLTD